MVTVSGSNAGHANLLPPVRPGDPGRNPKGINQYTYRQDAEKHLSAWCVKYGEDLIDKLLDEAKGGDTTMMKLALERILPAVKEVDLRIPGSDPAELVDGVAAFFNRRRTNGADRDALPSGTDGNGGMAP